MFVFEHQRSSIAIFGLPGQYLFTPHKGDSIFFPESLKEVWVGACFFRAMLDRSYEESFTDSITVSDTENIKYQNWEMEDSWLEHQHDSSSIPLKLGGFSYLS